MHDIRKFSRSDRHMGIDFTVDIWAHDGDLYEVRTIQVGEFPEQTFGDGQMQAKTYEEAWAMAVREVASFIATD